MLDRVGYLPEERGLYKKMQVRRVLLFLAELKGVRARRTPTAASTSGSSGSASHGRDKNWGDAKVDELSRGMQQKVQFIATLLHDPDLVILDEPFSGLDPINAQALKDAVVELKRRGKTVIFSTHIMDNAEKMCDSVCIIARGEKVLDGTRRGGEAARRARETSRWRSAGGAHATASRAVLRDAQLVQRVDDNNNYFELELAPDADAQLLLRRLHGGRREHRAVRAGAAVAPSNLPPARRRHGRRDRDVRPWIRRSSSSPSASTWSACAHAGSS